MTECWNCGRSLWLCELDHFFRPIVEGILTGLPFAIFFGVTIASIVNLVNWASQ